MIGFVLKRLAWLVLSLFVILSLTFLMLRLTPGNFYDEDRGLHPAVKQRMKEDLGLDRPLPVQYWRFMTQRLRGDFGYSEKHVDRTVNEKIRAFFPNSAILGGLALLLALLVGIPLGAVAAWKHNRSADYLASTVSIVGICIPSFVLAPLLVLVFAIWLDAFNVIVGDSGNPADWVLPVVVLAVLPIAVVARITRTGMLEALNQDYVRTARAKGLPESRVVFKHALRNGILAVISYLGPAAAALLTGSIVVERIFGMAGLGREFVDAALARDTTMVAGMAVFYSTILIVFNFLVDVLYTWVDPRIKL